jgi:hypothetical protein
MTITLDTITLPNLKMYPETFATQTLTRITERAIDGTLHEWIRNEPGYPADLIADANRGRITKAELDALNALALVPNATYELSYHGTVYSVRFRFDDPPVISAEQIKLESPEPDASRYNNIQIKLWVV